MKALFTVILLLAIALAAAAKPLPTSVDWRQRVGSKVRFQTPVCPGGSWAYAVASNIDSFLAIRYKTNVSTSLHELLSCTQLIGCVAGDKLGYRAAVSGYAYVQARGIHLEAAFPTWMPCIARGFLDKHRKPLVNIGGHQMLNDVSDEELMKVVARHPVTAIINSHCLKSYHGGVMREESKEVIPEAFAPKFRYPDHAVEIMGYGTTEATDYWILKNSWGKMWGEEGYMRLERGKKLCGINSAILFPIGVTMTDHLKPHPPPPARPLPPPPSSSAASHMPGLPWFGAAVAMAIFFAD